MIKTRLNPSHLRFVHLTFKCSLENDQKNSVQEGKIYNPNKTNPVQRHALLQKGKLLIYSIFSRAPRCLPVRLAAIRPTLRPCGASRRIVDGLPIC